MTADNRPWFRTCSVCGGTMVRQEDTTATEAGYRCIGCGRIERDSPVSWIPRQTPVVMDRKD